MKKVKMFKMFGIYEQTEKEMKDNNSTSKYILFTPEEMEYSPKLREIEFESDSIKELEDFVLGGNY